MLHKVVVVVTYKPWALPRHPWPVWFARGRRWCPRMTWRCWRRTRAGSPRPSSCTGPSSHWKFANVRSVVGGDRRGRVARLESFCTCTLPGRLCRGCPAGRSLHRWQPASGKSPQSSGHTRPRNWNNAIGDNQQKLKTQAATSAVHLLVLYELDCQRTLAHTSSCNHKEKVLQSGKLIPADKLTPDNDELVLRHPRAASHQRQYLLNKTNDVIIQHII